MTEVDPDRSNTTGAGAGAASAASAGAASAASASAASAAGAAGAGTDDEHAKRALLLSFVRALHRSGAPAHRLEREAGAVARTLVLQARFFSTPTMALASFGDDEVLASTHVLRVEPGEVDLGRLCELDEFGSAITAGERSIAAATAQAEALCSPRPRTSRWSAVIAASVAATAAARMMGGGSVELVCAAAIGLCTGLLGEATRGSEGLARLHLAAAGALAACVAGAVATRTPLAITLVTVAGVITLLPGLTLTVAMTELSTGHLASGSARSFAALTSLMQLAFGSLLGASIAARLGTTMSHGVEATALLPMAAAVFAGGVAFARLLEVRARELPYVLGAALLAWLAASVGESIAAGPPGVFLASAVVGVVGNGVSRLFAKPASLVLIPGILLLVPGSLGFRSLAELLAGDVVAGVASALSVGMIAMALASGQVVAHAIVPPRREL